MQQPVLKQATYSTRGDMLLLPSSLHAWRARALYLNSYKNELLPKAYKASAFLASNCESHPKTFYLCVIHHN